MSYFVANKYFRLVNERLDFTFYTGQSQNFCCFRYLLHDHFSVSRFEICAFLLEKHFRKRDCHKRFLVKVHKVE